MGQFLGSSIKRREDPGLIQGHKKYTDDLQLPNMTFAVIVRSPYAHAKINSIDTSQAEALDGVVGVFTGQDVVDSGVTLVHFRFSSVVIVIVAVFVVVFVLIHSFSF